MFIGYFLNSSRHPDSIGIGFISGSIFSKDAETSSA